MLKAQSTKDSLLLSAAIDDDDETNGEAACGKGKQKQWNDCCNGETPKRYYPAAFKPQRVSRNVSSLSFRLFFVGICLFLDMFLLHFVVQQQNVLLTHTTEISREFGMRLGKNRESLQQKRKAWKNDTVNTKNSNGKNLYSSPKLVSDFGESTDDSNKTIPVPPMLKKQNDPEFFAACLIMMDDNHRLPEWLAYHYHMLPLRYLIVMVDPRSTTTPHLIFQRWREHSDMTILQWNDTALYDSQRDKDPNYLHTGHVARQLTFYASCTKHLQEKFALHRKQLWTAFWDTDEFLFLNYKTISTHVQQERQPGSILSVLKHRVREWNVSSGFPVPQLSDSIIPLHLRHLNQPCTVVPRVTVTALEPKQDSHMLRNDTMSRDVRTSYSSSNNSPKLPKWLNSTRFETLRWHHHEFEGRNLISSRQGKSIVDVLHPSTVIYVQKREMMGIHRILSGGYCPSPPPRAESSFLLHHYMGSWEWYSARTADSRRGTVQHSRTVWELFSQYPDIAIDPSARYAWIQGFVADVGEGKAQLLLEGAGIIETTIATNTSESVDWNVTVASPFDILVRNMVSRLKKKK